jgi:small subunit ribosomal protein S18
MKDCFFKQHGITFIDYKDVEVLRKFVNPHGRILSGKRTGVSSKMQRQLADAIKRARFMGLMPFVAR